MISLSDFARDTIWLGNNRADIFFLCASIAMQDKPPGKQTAQAKYLRERDAHALFLAPDNVSVLANMQGLNS